MFLTIIDTVSIMGALFLYLPAGNSTHLCSSISPPQCLSSVVRLRCCFVEVGPYCGVRPQPPLGVNVWIAYSIDLVVSCYFDNYVCTSTPELATNAEQSFTCLLDLLGWEYDCDGAKNSEMSDIVSTLGTKFDFKDI